MDTIAMTAGYSEATKGAGHVIQAAAPLAIAALGPLLAVGGAAANCASVPTFGIADYGAADGGTSLPLIKSLVDAVRAARREGGEIAITYTDLPDNDWATVFRAWASCVEQDVRVLGSGMSFHRQVTPVRSVHLGVSFTAMHWLSSKPCELADHVHAVVPGVPAKQFELFRAQAARDWEAILLHRARELCRGGRLVMANFCVDAAGHHLGNTGGANIFAEFSRHWLSMRQDGSITADECASGTFPQFYRSCAEFTAPLTNEQSAVHAAGLRLVSIETRQVACPYAVEFRAHGDVGRFARELIGTLRSWSEIVFSSALSERPADERKRLVNEFYSRYERAIASEPERHSMDYVHAYMVVEQTQ